MNDDFISHGHIDQLSSENITQNSEIVSPLNSNETFNERSNANRSTRQQLHPNQQQQSIMTNIDGSASVSDNAIGEQEVNYRNTLTLSRVAFLYRQLEALEDSMRHTSFAPFMSSRTAINPGSNILNEAIGDRSRLVEVNQQNSPGSIVAQASDSSAPSHNETAEQSSHPSASTTITGTTATAPSSSTSSYSSSQSTGYPASGSGALTSNTLEPSLVSFDESLEQLQLRPLVLDGHIVNMANIIEQYPIDSPYQLHYVMQFESINQVNQNFIRISKLLSGARLYRQVAQQVTAAGTGNSHYPPNQVLTAQCASPRSSRNVSGLPLVFPTFASDSLNPSSLMRSGRASDPVLALQFRNSARNVPLVTVCKIDLLTARSICITRSQQLVEQALVNSRQQLDTAGNNQLQTGENTTVTTRPSDSTNSERTEDEQLYPLLMRLHHSLTSINHTPLTTSNVNTHVSSLRKTITAILNAISSLLQSSSDGQRLTHLVHSIAETLTGRNWNMPLGATLDELKLDVINILCVADLILHLARQVQLLQMHRISLLTRIEESRRATTNRTAVQLVADQQEQALQQQQPTTSEPMLEDPAPAQPSSSYPNEPRSSSSSGGENRPTGSMKRKSSLVGSSQKRTRIDEDVIIERQQPRVESMLPSLSNLTTPVNNQLNHLVTGSVNDSLPADRLLIWNSGQNQSIEQSLQRFFVASGMSNSHILVRIYHRMNLGPTTASGTFHRHSMEPSHPPSETRRRALSQDNSIGPPEANSSPSVLIDDRGRTGRPSSGSQEPPRPAGNLNQSQHNHNHHEPRQRQHHYAHPLLHLHQSRGPSPHLWFNQWTIPLPVNHSNYRIQCWDFSLAAIPNIKDSQANLITHKCRIYNDSSVDISEDGGLLACLVPRDNVATCLPSFDLRIYSLKSYDFGSCYYRLTHGPNAISVSLSPSGQYAVVGLASHKFVSHDPNEDDLTIAKIFKLSGKDNSIGYVRDIKIKKDESALSLNAIKWMHRGIVYNVGPQHHQRYQATRIRNIVAS